MPHWYDPLLSFLAEQPAETTSVMLTVAELTTLVEGRLPANAMTRSYWWHRKPSSVSVDLTAIGWRVIHMRGRPLAITFVRQSSDRSA